ncbi:MAG TPA: nucleotidyl transferase AbiEii/AbiGii toxin family protein, partial [Gemmataceae bacterium]|nr:nucleotidyl transferase AbiEii/AbiGii toxin family protein [Gemmataceae bacterium]
LLIWYPRVTAVDEGYVRPAVKIEAGAKSALDPNDLAIIQPYVADDVGMDLNVANVTTVVAERTFWDKAVILHGLRQWFERRGVLRGGGQRVSRHYYDLYRLLQSDAGRSACERPRSGSRLRASRPHVLQQYRS